MASIDGTTQKDKDKIDIFCSRNGKLIREDLLHQLKETCQISDPQNEIKNGDRLRKLDEVLVKRMDTTEFSKSITEEKTVYNLMLKLKNKLTKEDIGEMLADSKQDTFEKFAIKMLKTNYLSNDLTPLVNIFQETNGLEALAREIGEFMPEISKLNKKQFEEELYAFLYNPNVENEYLMLELKELMLTNIVDIPILASESGAGRFRDLYVDLMITDDVDKVTANEESGQLEIENCVKRSGPWLPEYDSADANKGKDLLNKLTKDKDKRIVLIGNPGTGKSIYCRKIVDLYVCGDLPQNRWTLLVTCRDSKWQEIEKDEKIKLKDKLDRFIEIALEDYENWKAIREDIIDQHGKNLLLIIDGLDEFPMNYFEDSLLLQILKMNVLKGCSLLITSRVGAFNGMMNKYRFIISLGKIYQVLGFNKAQRNEYIKKRLGEKSPIYERRLRRVLRNQRELDALSLIPVTIELLVSLIEESGVSQSLLSKGLNTLTDAYKEIIMFLIRRQIRRSQTIEIYAFETLENMPNFVYDYYLKICRIAFDGIKIRKIMFREHEIGSNPGLEGKELPIGLGLLVSSMRKKLEDTKTDHSFPHLTIQEYLTAFYMSYEYLYKDENQGKLLKDEKEKILAPKRKGFLEYFTGEKLKIYRMVAKFNCGLLGKEAVFLISCIFQEDQVKWLPFDGCIRTLTVDRREKYAKYTKSHLGALPYIVETKHINMLAFKQAQEAQATPEDGKKSQLGKFYFIIPNTKLDPIEFSSYCRVLSSEHLYETPLVCISVDLMRMDREDYELMVESLKNAFVRIVHIKFSGSQLDNEDHYRIGKKYREYFTTLTSVCRKNTFSGFYMDVECANFNNPKTLDHYMKLIPKRSIGLRFYACDFINKGDDRENTISLLRKLLLAREKKKTDDDNGYDVQFLDLTRTLHSMDPVIRGLGQRTNIRGIHLEDTYLDDPKDLFDLLKRQEELQELTVRKTFPKDIVLPHLPQPGLESFVFVD
ncbi:hypothetical protein LOD99_12174 [Oopsacas minuta]|uniref:NACHT domain-containing protein n=1 Tax=Oopsacas minuta TaxID=111878 RepID=A0AAV7JIV0_9METZ|nr:hypothetical protein LOD99_12174 [Oopsacas minuta]